ncbi:hypothetical protein GGR56DRAFT_691280 [Xylariaceae sp. FL0804]|nr:hypothetical protein GGR56DRAFT_691280 [Xylariaceae sp. FL0804]
MPAPPPSPSTTTTPGGLRLGHLSVTYTLALHDGALGTVPLTHARAPASLLRADVPEVAAALPRLLLALAASSLLDSGDDGDGDSSDTHAGRRRWWPWQWRWWQWWRSWQRRSHGRVSVLLYAVASVLQVQLLLSAALLWLVLPGLVLLPALALEAAAIWLLVFRLLNRGHDDNRPITVVLPRPRPVAGVANTPAPADEHENEQTREQEQARDCDRDHRDRACWILVPGLDAAGADHIRRATLPRLARLLGLDHHHQHHGGGDYGNGDGDDVYGGHGHDGDGCCADADVRALVPSRLGLPLDLAVVLAQRSLQLATARSTALYRAVREELLLRAKRDGNGGNGDGGGGGGGGRGSGRGGDVHVLAHGTGALDAAWALARLCADLPPGDVLGRLHVFTLGGAAAEMAVPLATAHQDEPRRAAYPSVTHFAFGDDPWAQIGVLLGIRQRLEGRLVGSLYTIQDNSPLPRRRLGALRQYAGYTVDGYLDALLPGGDARAGVLGHACRVDRELSERRELAALAARSSSSCGPGNGGGDHHRQQQQGREGRGGTGGGEKSKSSRATQKRVSWTTLGAVADAGRGGDDLDLAGAASVNEVRRRAKELEGMVGCVENPLVDAILGDRRLGQEEGVFRLADEYSTASIPSLRAMKGC